MRGALALALALGALAWAVQTGRSMLAPVGAALGAWLVFGALAEIAGRVRLGEAGAAESLRRLGNLPRADWGKALAHAGLGVTIFGVAAISAWAVEDIRAVAARRELRGRRLHAAARGGRGDARAELQRRDRDGRGDAATAGRWRRSTPRSGCIRCRAWRPPRRRSTAA